MDIVGKVALELTGKPETLEKLHNLSAVQLDGDWLWVASDELTTVERLHRSAEGERFGDHQSFALGELGVELPAGNEKEIDLEGMDLVGDQLWLVGSHSATRKELEPDDDEALAEFAEIRERPNRHLLFRIALERQADDVLPEERTGSTAALVGDLTEVLRSDEHVGQFVGLPSKENGLDVEGLAVVGDRVLLGLRGPVLRGWAVVVEVEPQTDSVDPTKLVLGSPPYRKHLLDLDGLGVRDLCRLGDDLLVLAGPTMALDGPVRVYRWPAPVNGPGAAIVGRDQLPVALELPYGEHDDHAEGITVVSPPGEPAQLLVVYDSPAADRLEEDGDELVCFADLTRPLA